MRRGRASDPAYQIIIRAIWCRGEQQRLALQHLRERGLWLSDEQQKQAGLLPAAEDD